MRKRILGLLMAFWLCLSCARADPSLILEDTSERYGTWTEAYATILKEKSADIQAYQEYTDLPSCHPVGLSDLTGDGIPELFFLTLFDNPEYGFRVGRFWVYTWDGRNVHCALTLTPETDDLLYSRYYATKNGLLTLYFSECEMNWTMKLRLDPGGHYTADEILIEEPDFSGESPDKYYLNDKKITFKKYKSLLAQYGVEQGSRIGTLMLEEGGSGFACTLEEALETLSSGAILQTLPEAGNETEKQLPELRFFRADFTAGQKFDVYSAPSTRSWRGAKGKAAVTSGSEIYAAGTEEDWTLIIYELGSGVVRVGYIDSRKINGLYPSFDALSFPRTQMTLTGSAVMTDDPIRQKATIGKLKKGTKVTCLARYRGWIYVEAKVSGKTARGFIAPSSLGLED